MLHFSRVGVSSFVLMLVSVFFSLQNYEPLVRSGISLLVPPRDGRGWINAASSFPWVTTPGTKQKWDFLSRLTKFYILKLIELGSPMSESSSRMPPLLPNANFVNREAKTNHKGELNWSPWAGNPHLQPLHYLSLSAGTWVLIFWIPIHKVLE